LTRVAVPIDHVDGEGVAGHPGDGEADAVDRDRVAVGRVAADQRPAQGQPGDGVRPGAGLGADDLAELFHDAGEHA
jgi:hypothetical protein